MEALLIGSEVENLLSVSIVSTARQEAPAAAPERIIDLTAMELGQVGGGHIIYEF